MECRNCEVDLVMSERQGVEIDYCPHRRGVWLDRGEFNKIIERSVQVPPGQAQVRPQNYTQHPLDDHHHGHSHNRKRSWFGELFG